MESAINEDPDAKVQLAPRAPYGSDLDLPLPREIATPAEGAMPKGRIVDDSARGSIFWEVVHDDMPEGQDQDETTLAAGGDTDYSDNSVDGGVESKTWGSPFKLKWLATNRLPFYKCRGIKNPLNNHREVKIARDGTEVEHSVGQRLVSLFLRPVHHPLSPYQMHMGYPPPY